MTWIRHASPSSTKTNMFTLNPKEPIPILQINCGKHRMSSLHYVETMHNWQQLVLTSKLAMRPLERNYQLLMKRSGGGIARVEQ